MRPVSLLTKKLVLIYVYTSHQPKSASGYCGPKQTYFRQLICLEAMW